MANDSEYIAAATAVAAGTADREQTRLNDRMAKQAGPKGEKARKAQRDAGKKK